MILSPVTSTVVEGGARPGLVSEALLHSNNRSTLLIAAEANSRSEWHLYDESVVALTDPTAADTLRVVARPATFERTKDGRP